MTKHPKHPHASEEDDGYYSVSDADVEAWAERERQRRKAWLEGPTEEEKRAWAARQSRRRRLDFVEDLDDLEEDVAEGRRVINRVHRDAATALVGVASRLAEAPYRMVGSLLKAGREWEDDLVSPPRRRSRVHLDDER